MIEKKKKNYLKFLKETIKNKQVKINKSVMKNNNIHYKNAIIVQKKKKKNPGLSQLEWKKNRFFFNLYLSRWELCKMINKNELFLIFKK